MSARIQQAACLSSLFFLCQIIGLASAQAPDAAANARGLPRVIIELSEITTDLPHLDELSAANSGDEFDAKMAALADAGELSVIGVYRLTSTSGQIVSMQFGQRVPVVTGVNRTPSGQTESIQVNNFGTSIEATAVIQGQTVALQLQYESSRQDLTVAESETPRRPTENTQQFRAVVPMRLNESTLVFASSYGNDRSLVARVKQLPIYIEAMAGSLRQVNEAAEPSSQPVADGASAGDARTTSRRLPDSSRTARQADDGDTGVTTRVLELGNPQDSQRRERIAREMVRRLDKDGDGVVSPAELPATSRERFNELDRDRNGTIDANELFVP